MRTPHIILLVLIAICGCAGESPTTPKNNNGPKGSIRGVIVGGLNGPIADATITTEPATDTLLTDINGAFAIDDVAPGVYLVKASKGDVSTSGNYTVLLNDTARPKLRLSIWKLAWSDEFDGVELDRTKWNIYTGWTGVAGMLHYARPENVIVESGMVRLQSLRQTYMGYDYTSGDINSTYAQKFGRFEVRARLPRGRGIWPAHWLWNGAISRQEIDIMEMLGHAPNSIYQTYHFENDRDSTETRGRMGIGPDYSQGFHVFAVEWYPDEIKWFIDGAQTFRTPTVGEQVPLYMILDTYIGGSWPGAPDSTTVFPQHHDIDYVRIYRAEE